jgi:hypothetical protein
MCRTFLPLDKNGGSQGDYDLAIAIDPVNAGLVYLGGSYAKQEPWPASIWRCAVGASGSGYKVTSSASIGTHAHSDVHVLVHTPDDPNELWCGCDGGVFLNQDARGKGEFTSQNNGLACLCCNYIGQHPTDPGTIYSGLQDNGTVLTTTGSIWTNFLGGDGGYCLVNWAQPNRVLSFSNGKVYRVDFSGSNPIWKMIKKLSWYTMTQPIVGVPYDPANRADAKLVAIGDGSDVLVSEDFGDSWPMKFSVPADAAYVFALAFASRTRLFAATTKGQVFRADRSGKKWALARLDNAPAGPLGLQGQINEVAVDWSDKTLRSIYVAFAGRGDKVFVVRGDDRRVWRFDGSKWEIRSGQPGVSHLLPVEHNAIAVDRAAPNNVYVGADIGCGIRRMAALIGLPSRTACPKLRCMIFSFIRLSGVCGRRHTGAGFTRFPWREGRVEHGSHSARI